MMDSCAGKLGVAAAVTVTAMVSQGCFSSASGGPQADASFDTGSTVDGFGGDSGEDASQPIDSGTGTDAPADTTPPVEAGHDAAEEAGQDAAAEAGPDASVLHAAWTWDNGSNAISSVGSYGTLGTPAASNAPPSREAASSATAPGEKLWVFGGYSYVGASSNSYFNDLWRYDVTSGDWTWMAGSSTTGAVGIYPATVGTGGSLSYFPGARSYTTTWADASGNVWLFGGTDGTSFFNDLWKFDGTYWTWEAGSNITGAVGSYPATVGTGGSLAYFPGARKGAASWIDAGGNLWLTGGDDNNNYFNDVWKFDGTYWTWVGGSSAMNTKGTYGTRGTPASGNIPGARLLGTFGVDPSGAFWLFGGFGVDGAGNRGYLNDLWKYSGGQWTWVSGGDVGDSPTPSAVYGVFPPSKGTTGATYLPGGRESACAWVDASGNFWVFGGWGYDGAGAQNYLNDLWKFDGTSWTWESGSNSANLPGVYGMLGTASLSNVPGARWNPLGWYAGGKLWMFSGSGDDSATTPGVLNDLWSYLP
jgi:N-acetylneuraminic acid mutarotase